LVFACNKIGGGKINNRDEGMISNSNYRKILGTIGKRWWFLAVIILLQAIPPYASRGYALRDWATVNAYVLAHPIKNVSSGLYPIFKIIPMILVAAIFLAGRRVARIFAAYVALSCVAFAFLQSISISDQYGFAMVAANVATFLVLAGFWFWEALYPKNIFNPQTKPVGSYWPFLLALLPFWEPVNPHTMLPDFNPAYLFTSGAGLSFCLVTPLYLAILAFYFPHVNKPVFLATAFVGVLMGLGNMVLEFIIYPAWWWIGVLHIPLLFLSAYCVALSFGEIASGPAVQSHPAG
jgi:hypothetical protein